MKRKFNFHPVIYVLEGLAWCLLAYVSFKYMRHLIHDPDTWWQLANGREMLEKRVFLRTEVFSHTMAGTDWINFEWLSQLLMVLLVKAGGFKGFFAAKVFLGMTSLALLILCLWKAGARGPLLWLLSWLGYHILQVRLCTRVELASLNLMPLMILLLMILRKSGPDHMRNIKWLFLGLMILWCNLHAGFIYGLGFAIFWSISLRLSGDSNDVIEKTDSVAVLLLLGVLINPFGPKLFEMFFKTLLDFKLSPHILSEWEPPAVKSAPYFWTTYVISAVLIIGVIRKRWKDLYVWIPGVVLFSIWGSFYLRNTTLYAFVALPFIAAALSKIKFQQNNRHLFITLGWIFCLGLVGGIDKDYLTKRLPRGLVDWNLYPVRAAEFIKKENIDGHMFNTFSFGGYLSWELGPERKIFMDGRYIFYPLLIEEENLKNGKQFEVAKEPWQRFFDSYGVDYAVNAYDPLQLMPPAGELVGSSIIELMYPPERWALVYWDDTAMVFLKRVPKFASLIRNLEYRRLRPYFPEKFFIELKNGKTNKKAAEDEIRRHDEATGLTFRGSQLKYVLSRI